MNDHPWLVAVVSAAAGAVLSLAATFTGIIDSSSRVNQDIKVDSNGGNVTINPSPSNCPSGWRFAEPNDTHSVEQRCIQGDWVVVLYPDLTYCNYGVNTQAGANGPRRVDCDDIPGWPEDRIPTEDMTR